MQSAPPGSEGRSSKFLVSRYGSGRCRAGQALPQEVVLPEEPVLDLSRADPAPYRGVPVLVEGGGVEELECRGGEPTVRTGSPIVGRFPLQSGVQQNCEAAGLGVLPGGVWGHCEDVVRGPRL